MVDLGAVGVGHSLLKKSPHVGSGSCGFLLEWAQSVSWLDVVRGD